MLPTGVAVGPCRRLRRIRTPAHWKGFQGAQLDSLPCPLSCRPRPVLPPGGSRVGEREGGPESAATVQENRPESPACSGGVQPAAGSPASRIP